MNHPVPDSTRDLPVAHHRKSKWRFSLVWLVPILAAVVGGYLVYQRAQEFGDAITIRFQDVEGVKPGQTALQYRGIDIGQVSALTLSPDHQSALVEVKLRRSAAFVARVDSQFWLVRPQLGVGNLTGLGTLITGPYIAVQPGKGKAAAIFTSLEYSPLNLDPHGLNVVLLSSHVGSLRVGVPIYYRGIEVGTVRETRLSTNATTVEIRAVVQRRYAPLVRAESKFWNVSGLDVRVGLFHGAEINVESLKSLLLGGIAFATPDDSKPVPLTDGTFFRLYDAPEKDWAKWTPNIVVQPEEPNPETKETPATAEIALPGRN